MFRDNYLSIDWLNVQVSHFPNRRLQGFMQEFSHPVQRFCEHIAADKVYFIEFNFKKFSKFGHMQAAKFSLSENHMDLKNVNL